MTTKEYKLRVKETSHKNGRYHYYVTDENGDVVSERRSNRTYVACTVSGSMYFGRRDLVGKGEHGRLIKYFEEVVAAGGRGSYTLEAATEHLQALRTIAYLTE